MYSIQQWKENENRKIRIRDHALIPELYKKTAEMRGEIHKFNFFELYHSVM